MIKCRLPKRKRLTAVPIPKQRIGAGIIRIGIPLGGWRNGEKQRNNGYVIRNANHLRYIFINGTQRVELPDRLIRTTARLFDLKKHLSFLCICARNFFLYLKNSFRIRARWRIRFLRNLINPIIPWLKREIGALIRCRIGCVLTTAAVNKHKDNKQNTPGATIFKHNQAT